MRAPQWLEITHKSRTKGPLHTSLGHRPRKAANLDKGCKPDAFPSMPQSLSEILIHAVFSTKDRAGLIPGELQEPLHAFLAGVCRKAGCEGLRVGGVSDHVHLAIRLSRA